MTKQRRLICEIIGRSQAHLSADEIYLEAKQLCPSIAVGTIYRNLNLLVSEGLIQRIPMDGEADRFDKNPIPHAHIICQCCHDVSDLPLPDISAIIQESTGIVPTSYTLNVYHVCVECENKSKIEMEKEKLL